MRYGSRTDLGFDYYKALSFAGLGYKIKNKEEQDVWMDTDSFKKLIPNEFDRNKIKEIIENERYATKKSKGAKCN